MRPSLSSFTHRYWIFCQMSFEPTKLAHRGTEVLLFFAEIPEHLVPQNLQESNLAEEPGENFSGLRRPVGTGRISGPALML